MGRGFLSKYGLTGHFSQFLICIPTTEETKRAPSLIARSPGYTRLSAHIFSQRETGSDGETSVKSQCRSHTRNRAVQLRSGQVGRHSLCIGIRTSIITSSPELVGGMMRDESAVGMMVAGCRVTKENGGTQFIPGSHLW